MYVIESAGLTDVGKKRKNNEDSLFLSDTQKLYVVADGMGGHRGGELASRIVIGCCPASTLRTKVFSRQHKASRRIVGWVQPSLAYILQTIH